MSENSLDNLPEHWSKATTHEGRTFYIDHQSQRTQWEHPSANSTEIERNNFELDWIENSQNSMLTNENFFKDTSQVSSLKDITNEEADMNYGHQSNALQILYGKDLTGLTAIVTGANSGIGFEISRSLAKHGCQVILACRNLTQGEAACSRIRKEKENVNVSCRELNLCSLRSVKLFSEQFRQEAVPLHLLILNAGVLKADFNLTEDGFEEMFQVNYLSQAFLSFALLPAMLTTQTNLPARIVAVSCESHRIDCSGISLTNGIIPERLSPRSSAHFDHLISYGQSKLCLIMFMSQFRRVYPQIYSVACHPGNVIYSNLTRHSSFYRFLTFISRPFSKSLQQAAATPIYCSIMKSVLYYSSVYYNNCSDGSPSSTVYNVKLIEELWILTQTMIESALKKQPLVI